MEKPETIIMVNMMNILKQNVKKQMLLKKNPSKDQKKNLRPTMKIYTTTQLEATIGHQWVAIMMAYTDSIMMANINNYILLLQALMISTIQSMEVTIIQCMVASMMEILEVIIMVN